MELGNGSGAAGSTPRHGREMGRRAPARGWELARVRAWARGVVLLGLLTLAPLPVGAFGYVVQPGDTLASIAENFYGRIELEGVLVAANRLELQGSPIRPGQRLEVPAVEHRRVQPGDTWQSLASNLLGSPRRADVLALANDGKPWIPPSEGTEIVIPYNLPVLVGQSDTIVTIARRYLGDPEQAWVLDHYNGLGGRPLARGDLVLVPLVDLALTDAGRAAAKASVGARCSEAQGEGRAAQRRVAAELPQLLADVRQGRYLEAALRGTRFLASASLSTRDLGVVHRQLLEAYAALDAPGQAAAACAAWLASDPGARLDPAWMSPKVLAACARR